MRRTLHMAVVGALCLGVLAAPRARAFDDADAVRVIGFARTQLAATTRELPGSTSSPKAARTDGTWTTVSNTDAVAWTQGFFPGSMWLMFQVADEPLWRDRADRWTRPLEGQKTNRQTHDLGFKLFLSFGQAYRLTGDSYYRGVLLTAAESLAARYRSRFGIIDCCDWNSAWDTPLVTDTMVNIELLLWAAANGGRSELRTMALNHALATYRDAVRPDGSTFHYVDYNSSTGGIRSKGTFQGYSAGSTWARGHVWTMYGFTMVYRYTRDARMLEAARKVTDWYLDHLPADMVPNWDFDAPRQQKDSSAAAAAASALLELSTLESDSTRAARYRAAALRMLDTLVSPAYFAEGTNSPGLLLHGVGHLPAGQEIDTTLIYGDYYLLEAVLRFNPRPPYPWYSKTSFYQSQHLLGSGNTGVRTLEFDVTPRRYPLDSTVGYSDSSTEVTGYSSLNLTVRLNSSGYFDVRNGGGYAALTRVPYANGQTYHVRILVDLPAQRYSVWVRPPGGSEVRIADRYAFRTGAPFINDIGRASVRTVLADSDFRVTGHRVASGATASAAGVGLPGAVLETVGTQEAVDALLPGPVGISVDGEAGEAERYGCGSAAGAPLPLAMLALLGWMARRRRWA